MRAAAKSGDVNCRSPPRESEPVTLSSSRRYVVVRKFRIRDTDEEVQPSPEAAEDTAEERRRAGTMRRSESARRRVPRKNQKEEQADERTDMSAAERLDMTVEEVTRGGCV